MENKGFLVPILLAAATLLLAGCAGATPTAVFEATLQAAPGEAGAEPPAIQLTDEPQIVERGVGEGTLVSPTAPLILESQRPGATTTAGEVVSGPAVAQEPTPLPVRNALEATNPTTVQLASGKVQLVEFFAFW